MDHGSACSPFTLITIRPIDERQRRVKPLLILSPGDVQTWLGKLA